MIEAEQEFQVAVKLLDTLHKLLNRHLIGFLQALADVVPFGLSAIIAENGEEMKPHALHEGVPQLSALLSMLDSLDIGPWGGIYLLSHNLGQGFLAISVMRLEYSWNTCSATKAISALAFS